MPDWAKHGATWELLAEGIASEITGSNNRDRNLGIKIPGEISSVQSFCQDLCIRNRSQPAPRSQSQSVLPSMSRWNYNTGRIRSQKTVPRHQP